MGEKKLLGIILNPKHWKPIVYDSKITIFTDHSNLLHETEMSYQRMQRWKIILQEYAITIKYVKGNVNKGADFLLK